MVTDPAEFVIAGTDTAQAFPGPGVERLADTVG